MQPEPCCHLVSSCVCLLLPLSLIQLLNFSILHFPHLLTLSHIKVCLAASCCGSSSSITSALRLWLIFVESLLNRLPVTSHRPRALHPGPLHFYFTDKPCYFPLMPVLSCNIRNFHSYHLRPVFTEQKSFFLIFLCLFFLKSRKFLGSHFSHI